MLKHSSALGAFVWLLIAGCSASGGNATSGPPSDPPEEMTEPTATAPPLIEPVPTTVPSVDPVPPPTTTASSEPPPTTTAPTPAYDLNVHFEWPETDPASGACEPGTYTGTFACDLAFIPGFPPTVFTGPLTFTLAQSSMGEFLEINGRFDAVTNGLPFGADLVGSLDCGTKKLEATLDNGTYGTAPFGGTFYGSLEGTLDPLSSTLSGTWSLTAGTPTMPQAAPCNGGWTVVLQP